MFRFDNVRQPAGKAGANPLFGNAVEQATSCTPKGENRMRRLLKRAAATMSGLALALTVTIGSELPASAAPSAAACKASFTRYVTIKKGSTGRQTKAAQCLLRSAGYSRVRVDGSFSATDVRQLKRFQAKHRIRTTG